VELSERRRRQIRRITTRSKGYWTTVTDPPSAETAITEKWPWSARHSSRGSSSNAGAGLELCVLQRASRLHGGGKASAPAQRRAKFWAYRVTEPQSRPQLGDLIAKDRPNEDGRCGGATYDNIDNGTAWNTHSDVVVDIAGNSISTIGGNLSDSVGLTTYSLGSNGLIVQPSGCLLIAVLRPPGGGGGGGGGTPPPRPDPPPYSPILCSVEAATGRALPQ
jgi:hypothetical protein